MSNAPETMTIQSHKGPYTVHFDENAIDTLNANVRDDEHYIIDNNVAELYADRLGNVLGAASVLRIDATETNKSLDRMPDYVMHLTGHGVRRDHTLVAIGGGIIQDITCFLGATMMRGMDWKLYPTTLLSQADSCIGSKSSINAGNAKNIVGTFTPPNEVFIATDFLATLDEKDLRSGVGEILKVHAIEGPGAFQDIATDYEQLFSDPSVMARYIRRALTIKLPYIESDEFDKGARNIFNYGHSFGHAIEAATNFAIPHGIGVTMGMDMANFISDRLEIGSRETFERMHPTLRTNYRGYEDLDVPLEPFLTAISKDKKNTGSGKVTLILPDEAAKLSKQVCDASQLFNDSCSEFFDAARAQ